MVGKYIVIIYINNLYLCYYGVYVCDVVFNLVCNVVFFCVVIFINNFFFNWLFFFDLWFFSCGYVVDGYSF